MSREAAITIPWLRQQFAANDYVCGDEIVIPVYLSTALQRPLLVEGEPGVGKTELAKVMAAIFKTELIRLQCYEGLDSNAALYEWNYQKQIIMIQMTRDEDEARSLEKDIFSEEYLLSRPLLKAIRADRRVVLLIDEIDRTDEEFEAFLFEILSDFQVSIPELGTIVAKHVPAVVLTSNRSRELSDALRRRCVYCFIDFPSVEKETRILQARVPGISEKLARHAASAVSYIRTSDKAKKPPSVAEAIDWAKALMLLGNEAVSEEGIKHTLSLLLKNKDDLAEFGKPEEVREMAGRAAAAMS